MIVAINKLAIELSGGEKFAGSNNMRAGTSLSFVEWISTNKVFGKPIFSSIFHKAAGYLYFIIKEHCFIDGNKRTALAAAVTFLEWNDILFDPEDDDDVYERISYFAKSEEPPDKLIPKIASWLRRVCVD
ncbi:MAG TPA: type II toxin-antitoxin system death-on-curing family toxin [Dehalococcoidia bacterium]|nr:type II toxin-antitoxin system death-on-curing family toxin [Dehalococcoidia bacterium]